MKNSRKIAYTATFIALIFVALMLDTWVGSFLPVKPAIFSLPTVFTFVLIFGSWQYALLGGTAFGVLSFARAFITGSLPFQNPLVSIAPRIVVGLVMYGAYILGKKLFSRAKNGEPFAIGLSSLVGVLTNTITVLTMMFAFDFTTLAGVFGAIVSFNFPFEIIATTLLTPFLVMGVRRGLRIEVKRNDGDKEIEK